LNRIDDIIMFNRLSKDNIKQITALTIANIEKRLKSRGITLKLTPEALDWVANNGYDEVYGARPLKRLLKKELENKLALALLANEISDNQEIKVELKEDGLAFKG
ncbi:MAG: ATP-dependent chaperone ClpB, partial [Alphaproteobacteria bacterium]|nr:ATP-dependent chaperone ClpB [Alphaproteobacteria bacterium]